MTGLQINKLCQEAKFDALDGLQRKIFKLPEMQSYYDYEYFRYFKLSA